MKQALLIYAATEPGSPQFSADLLWRTHFQVPDPVLYFEIEGRNGLLVSSLEFNRAKKEAQVDEVILLDDIMPKEEPRTMIAGIKAFLAAREIKEIRIPGTMPYALGKNLSETFEIQIASSPVFPERAIKTEYEIDEIEKTGKAVGLALHEVRLVLKASSIHDQEVIYNNKPLTSEFLRGVIEKKLFEEGYTATSTIVSCGVQAADPHALGSGPIKPHEPIVCDIFPSSTTSHYHADITRTLFKGAPDKNMGAMYEAVRAAQVAGITAVRAGVDAKDLQTLTEERFKELGYPTTAQNGVSEGFIHSLGHGLGLEVHEEPHVGGISHILEVGNVITIEPGLYYPKPKGDIPAGGIRIEDMVFVDKEGSRVLAELPRDLAWAVIP